MARLGGRCHGNPRIPVVLVVAAVLCWMHWFSFPADMELLAYQSGRTRDIPAFAVHSGDKLYPQDHLYARWKSKVPAYLYLVHLHIRNGSIRILYPSARVPINNPLPADQEVFLPPMGGYWLLDENEGEHLLLFLADKSPWQDVEGCLQDWNKRIVKTPAQEREEWLRRQAKEAYPLRKSIRFYNRP